MLPSPRNEIRIGTSYRSGSARQPASIDRQDHALHVVRGAGREEYRGAAQVLGISPTTGRDAPEDFRIALRVRLQRGGIVRREVTRRDCVHVDAARGPLVGEQLRETGDPALARGVGG